jgi:Fungal specific transcription factor domain
LVKLEVDPAALQKEILAVLGQRLLEILALGSLETVQTCVLLGTYYLYHGEPDLAWPICGCGLRVAQAIGLHRKIEMSNILTPGSRESWSRTNEARKRCWWAIYEVETFCSMLYGLPLSIADSDCDVEHLDPLAPPLNSHSSPSAFTTLLHYKPIMSRLSIILKAALTDLYKIQADSAGTLHTASDHTARLRHTVQKVWELDACLHQWHEKLPVELRFSQSQSFNLDMYADQELEGDVGASGPRFERLVLGLQALALELAYENAKILIHRPLLTYKMTARLSPHASLNDTGQSLDPCQMSVQNCYEAALKTSELGSVPMFRHACDGYAAAFISMHLLTAGITLCMMASLEPLSGQSQEAKLGIQRLMHMQTYVKSRSAPADQSLEILKKLITLVMEKELGSLLASPSQSTLPQQSSRVGQSNSSAGLTIAELQETGDPYLARGVSGGRPQADGDQGKLPSYSSSLRQPQTAAPDRILPEDFADLAYDFDENQGMMQAILNFDQGKYWWLYYASTFRPLNDADHRPKCFNLLTKRITMQSQHSRNLGTIQSIF